MRDVERMIRRDRGVSTGRGVVLPMLTGDGVTRFKIATIETRRGKTLTTNAVVEIFGLTEERAETAGELGTDDMRAGHRVGHAAQGAGVDDRGRIDAKLG